MSVHPSAIVHPDAVVDATAQIGPHVVIEGPVQIGPECHVGPSAVLIGHTEIGAGCRIHAHAVIGDVPQDNKFAGETSFCRIGRRCVIREGVTVHRAVGDGEATVIGDDCYLMTNAHVAHDCVLEDEVTLVSGSLLGGHVRIGRGAIVSGNVGVHQFVRIGELAMLGAVAMIAQDVPPFLMTDRDGSVVGLNSVGVLRAGMALEERSELKRLFKLMYHSQMGMDQAVQVAGQSAVTAPGRRFVEFFQDGSARGFRKGVVRRRKAA